MKRLILILILLLLTGCASMEDDMQPAHPVDGMRRVVDSLVTEIVQRSASEGFRNLPIVVVTTATASGGLEPIVAEFLRTRLVERSMAVHVECAARCMEVKLQEFSIDAPKVSGLTAGQVFTVVGGSIPIVGGAIRSLGEQERESRRAAARATGVLVTLSARDGNRYGARANVVGIVSASGDVALQQK
jgi:hypothetical protein